MAAAYRRAAEIADEDVAINRAIGRHGAEADRGRSPRARSRASRSTCSPIATPAGSPPSISAPRRRRSTWRTTRAWRIHVWVDETRPRNQGASLTAWELGQHGVPHTVIPDNTGGHLMQHGMVDLAIVGTDRVTAQGDVCNKIGTYLKALAAQGQRRAVLCGAAVADHRLHGVGRRRRDSRSSSAAPRRVATMTGRTADGRIETVRIVPDGSPVANYRLRRDAGAARHRADHRARHYCAEPGGARPGFRRARACGSIGDQ